jgi:hypothetical protein
LNSSEQSIVQSHIEGLRQFLDLEQPITLRESVLTNDQAHGVMIAGLLVGGKGIKLDKASSDQLTEEYLDAIEDLPAWAVREALRKWNRGDSVRLDGKPHNFEWRPAPPTLRRLAVHEVATLNGRIVNLQKLLDAVPLVEYSDEHRANMLKRLSTVLHEAADKPVQTVGEAAE